MRAAAKPAPAYLTRFYLMVSLGGALGGVAVGLVAVKVFNTYYEFGLGLVLTLAIAAFVTGLAVLRPAMMKAMALAQSLGPSSTPEERQRVGGEAQRLRTRAAVAGKAVNHLLFFALAAMAVARYLG